MVQMLPVACFGKSNLIGSQACLPVHVLCRSAVMLQWWNREVATGITWLLSPPKIYDPWLKTIKAYFLPTLCALLLISHSGTQTSGARTILMYAREDRILEGLMWTVKCLGPK